MPIWVLGASSTKLTSWTFTTFWSTVRPFCIFFRSALRNGLFSSIWNIFRSPFLGLFKRLVSSPSLVNKRSPVVFLSILPTGFNSTLVAFEIRPIAVRFPCSLRAVVVKSLGLLSNTYSRFAGFNKRPSNRTSSVRFTLCPISVTGFPLTVTLPAVISTSASLREQTPEFERYLFNRIRSGLLGDWLLPFPFIGFIGAFPLEKLFFLKSPPCRPDSF